MADQIENTLRSLLPPYQRGIRLEEIEIILVDNGSTAPLPDRLRTFSPNLRYEYFPPCEARPSPAAAMNRGVNWSRAPWLCLMIDGARMVTPGVLSLALRLITLAPNSVVEVRGWHLGPAFQPESVAAGYNHETETKLLHDVQWWENGYRLFKIAADSAQTQRGLDQPAAESNCFFLSRALFEAIGGFDERYAEPGGGHVNLDFYARAVTAAETCWTLLGEGTFHQVHGGAATSLSLEDLHVAGERWRAESLRLRGPIEPVDNSKFILAGHLPAEFQTWLRRNHSER
jgi:glycosyltransferase involved in cell wall biosynthesis